MPVPRDNDGLDIATLKRRESFVQRRAHIVHLLNRCSEGSEHQKDGFRVRLLTSFVHVHIRRLHTVKPCELRELSVQRSPRGCPGWKPGKTRVVFAVRMCLVRISANTFRKSVVSARSRPSNSCSWASPGHLP